MTNNTAFIGLDTHKETIPVAIAEDGRNGEVRYVGQIANEPAAVLKLVKRLAGDYAKHESLPESRIMRSPPRCLTPVPSTAIIVSYDTTQRPRP